MPYKLSLQAYCLPEFFIEAPESWERRLREISPVLPNLAHLRFRKFEARPDWASSPYNTQPDRPIWALYSCTPRHLITKEKAAEFEKHWSEVSLEPEKAHPEGAQVAQRAIVSDYQHFMWHTQGVSVRPFWFLQGEWGGTPAKLTDREKAVLRGTGMESVAAAPGTFAGCPFDERAVQAILARDRLIQAGNRLDELEKMDTSDAMRWEDNEAEKLYRETVLDTMRNLAAPAVEFMGSQTGKAQAADYLPPAPEGLTTTLATWKDVWKEHGKLPMAGMAAARKVQVSVQ